MTRIKRLAPLVLVLLAACASTDNQPATQWGIARESLTTTQDTARVMNEAGLLSDEALVAAAPYARAARTALEKAILELPDGGTTFDMWMNVFRESLIQLQARQGQ